MFSLAARQLEIAADENRIRHPSNLRLRSQHVTMFVAVMLTKRDGT
jgi:hypothetical protein